MNKSGQIWIQKINPTCREEVRFGSAKEWVDGSFTRLKVAKTYHRLSLSLNLFLSLTTTLGHLPSSLHQPLSLSLSLSSRVYAQLLILKVGTFLSLIRTICSVNQSSSLCKVGTYTAPLVYGRGVRTRVDNQVGSPLLKTNYNFIPVPSIVFEGPFLCSIFVAWEGSLLCLGISDLSEIFSSHWADVSYVWLLAICCTELSSA